jgi:hypothetical protein
MKDITATVYVIIHSIEAISTVRISKSIFCQSSSINGAMVSISTFIISIAIKLVVEGIFFLFAFSPFLLKINSFLWRTKKPLKGIKRHLEAFSSASSGNPLSWLSPRKLRVKSYGFLNIANSR